MSPVPAELLLVTLGHTAILNKSTNETKHHLQHLSKRGSNYYRFDQSSTPLMIL